MHQPSPKSGNLKSFTNKDQKRLKRMQVLQKWVFFIISASFLVLLLVPLVHSSHESHQQANGPRSNKYGVEKITPELSFEITLHGFLLWASMGFLMPVGILIIRMSNTEKCGRRLKVLFYFHVIVQMLSVLLATAAAIMSIKFFDNSFNNKHRRIGVALYAIIWIQALIGLRRPERGSKRRTMWFFLHWVLGSGVSILGIINTYTGLQAYHKRTSRSVKLWTTLLTAEVCLIAFLYLFQEKWDYMKKQGVVLGIQPVTSIGQANTPRDNQKDLIFPC